MGTMITDSGMIDMDEWLNQEGYYSQDLTSELRGIIGDAYASPGRIKDALEWMTSPGGFEPQIIMTINTGMLDHSLDRDPIITVARMEYDNEVRELIILHGIGNHYLVGSECDVFETEGTCLSHGIHIP